MHISAYTQIIHQIFFNESQIYLDSLICLNDKEKKLFLDHVSSSRIEKLFIEKVKPSNIKNIFGLSGFKFIERNSNIRTITTIENKRYAKLISSRLLKKNIAHQFLKGINMHEYFYENHSIRPITDFDLLIQKKDLIETLGICKEMGFDTKRWDLKKSNNLKVYRNPTLKHKNVIAQIDIHLEFSSFIFSNSLEYKNFYFDLLDTAISKKMILCSMEDTFIHCLFHGTTQSAYNVGPIFIMDLIKMFQSEKIDWLDVKKKIKKYRLQKELNNILFYISNFISVPVELREKDYSTNLELTELKDVLLAPPKNTSIFSITKINDFKILIKKLFYTEYLYHHNYQKFYLKYFLINLLSLLKNHLLKVLYKKDSNIISKNRFKLLRDE